MLPAIIGAAGALGGGALSGFLSYKGQKEANETNAKIASENRDWQEKMSNTAYQRQRADLEKAGYNPMLAINGGGASTPAGNTATMQNAYAGASDSIRSSMSDLMNTLSSLADIKIKGQQLNNLRAEEDNSIINNDLIKANVGVSVANAKNLDASTKKYLQDILFSKQDMRLRGYEENELKTKSNLWKMGVKPSDRVSNYADYLLDNLGKMFNKTSSAKDVKKLTNPFKDFKGSPFDAGINKFLGK